MHSGTRKSKRAGLNTVGLFAGIGGLEVGLHRAGHSTTLFCEIDEAARAVLRARFPDVPNIPDVRKLTSGNLPSDTELIVGGFPCQDLSQAGETNGIQGRESGLVTNLFRVLKRQRAPWILLENVPFMLQLGKGAAMTFIVDQLEKLGYKWAYRVIDTRAFGIPQRRQRVYLVASTASDPAHLLFKTDEGEPEPKEWTGRPCGFFWTEGRRGLGWAVDSVPTLKGGSGLGIPSPPAIWLPDGRIVTPDIRDAEKLQGFEVDWTKPAENVTRAGYRWKLVGNAVTVDAAEWLGNTILEEPGEIRSLPLPLRGNGSWPKAAFGSKRGGRFWLDASAWPIRTPITPILEFLDFEPKLLSAKATAGFMSRLESSSLRYPAEFMVALKAHHDRMLSADSSQGAVSSSQDAEPASKAALAS